MNEGIFHLVLRHKDYRNEFAENMKRAYEDVTNLIHAKLYANAEVLPLNLMVGTKWTMMIRW